MTEFKIGDRVRVNRERLEWMSYDLRIQMAGAVGVIERICGNQLKSAWVKFNYQEEPENWSLSSLELYDNSANWVPDSLEELKIEQEFNDMQIFIKI